MKKIKEMFIKRKIVSGLILAVLFGFGVYKTVLALRKPTVQYQTMIAEKGTLISSISGSGTITSGNYTNITTKTSGTVKKVDVTNGDKVVKGQKIAEVELDDYAKERQAAAWVAYLEATEAVKDARRARLSADIQMWKDRETILKAQEDVNNNKGDTEGERIIVKKTLEEARLAFSVSESKYLNANADIVNAQAKVSSAWRTYQENSATIVAPSAGTISDLSLAEGITVTANSTTSSTSGATIVSAQTVGKINNTQGQLIASVSLTEIDIITVKANQKVTITLDAYPDKTFTGKVLAVNTSGGVSSGVTSYPVTILLDPVTVDIYPNMAVTTEIITNIETDVILIPTAAIQTENNQTTAQIMKDGVPQSVTVEIGNANDSQTVIASGINEGDEVITSIISSEKSTNSESTSASPFSGFGGSSSTRSGGGEMRFVGPGF